ARPGARGPQRARVRGRIMSGLGKTRPRNERFAYMPCQVCIAARRVNRVAPIRGCAHSPRSATREGKPGRIRMPIRTKQLAHVCIFADDLAATRDFYRDVLGMEIVFNFMCKGAWYGYYLGANGR